MNTKEFTSIADFSERATNNGHDKKPVKKTATTSFTGFKKWLTNLMRSQTNKNGSNSNCSSQRLPVEKTFSCSATITSFFTFGFNSQSFANASLSSVSGSETNLGLITASTLTASDSMPESANIAAFADTAGTSSISGESAKNITIATSGSVTPEENCDIGALELPIQEDKFQVFDADSNTSVSSVNAEKADFQPIETLVDNLTLGKNFAFEDCLSVTADNDNGDVSDGGNESVNRLTETEKALQKRVFILQELIETERDYVQHLGMIAHGYMTTLAPADYESNGLNLAQADDAGIATLKNCDNTITVPDDLKGGKEKMIFGNILNIYRFHMNTFCPEIEKCGKEPELLGGIFQKHERRLNMYVVYCQNKPKSEYIVSEYLDTLLEKIRQKLGHKLQLPDLLIKPIQRIMKYQLLLRDILKYTEKAAIESEAVDLRNALQIMHVVPKTANDMMMVNRLQGFNRKIHTHGRLLQQGQLLVADVDLSSSSSAIAAVKLKERQVFLFEQIIIFSEVVGQKTQFSNVRYVYKKCLNVNKMTLEGMSDTGRFILRNKDPQQKHFAVFCEGLTREDTTEWICNIQVILDTQLAFRRALQLPIVYQEELTKKISAPELNFMWNPSLRKTLSHPSHVHKDLKRRYASTTLTDSQPKTVSAEVTSAELASVVEIHGIRTQNQYQTDFKNFRLLSFAGREACGKREKKIRHADQQLCGVISTADETF